MLLGVNRLTRYNLQPRRLVNIFVNYAILIHENVEKKVKYTNFEFQPVFVYSAHRSH